MFIICIMLIVSVSSCISVDDRKKIDALINNVKYLTSTILAIRPDASFTYVKNYFFELNPNFKNDKLYLELFRAIYDTIRTENKLS